MTKLKKYNTLTDWNNATELIYPSVGKLSDGSVVFMEKPNNIGDIAYWDGRAVKTTPYEQYDYSDGPIVGIVIIPKKFAPDERTRIISLYGTSTEGSPTNEYIEFVWGEKTTSTSDNAYTTVPILGNSSGYDTYGYLPSDKFSGDVSTADPVARYHSEAGSLIIPSPFLGVKPNPDYKKYVLSTFMGLEESSRIMSKNPGVTAAKACWNYRDGHSNLQWFLPSVGELGFLIPRFNMINNIINMFGGQLLHDDYSYWSSTRYLSKSAWTLSPKTGRLNRNTNINSDVLCRPFAIID